MSEELDKISKLIDAIATLSEVVGSVANSLEEFASEVEKVLNIDISHQFHRNLFDLESEADAVANEVVKFDETN